MAVGLKDQIVKGYEPKIENCYFWTQSTDVLHCIHSYTRKQQVFVANRFVEIFNTTDASQWNDVNGINNPADIGTRTINVDQLRRSEWLKQPDSEWPEQVNLEFGSDKQSQQIAFISTTKEKEPIVKRERFSSFNRLVNTMAYVQRLFNKHKPATKTLGIEERENSQARIFRLLQQEQFAEEKKNSKDAFVPKAA